MLRRNGSGRLRGGHSGGRAREEVNPMATVANLVDAMLVLAVGIMLALIISWNLNVSENGQVTEKVDKDKAVSSFTDDDLQKKEDNSSKLEKQGTVYYDPETDQYYVIASNGSKMEIGN